MKVFDAACKLDESFPGLPGLARCVANVFFLKMRSLQPLSTIPEERNHDMCKETLFTDDILELSNGEIRTGHKVGTVRSLKPAAW